jgi:hypothetical protein
VAVECGDTTLFVWNDVDPATNTATVAGFLPFKGSPFPAGTLMIVAMNGNGTVRAFRTDSSAGSIKHWFGDYQTAGCYETVDTEGGVVRSSYHFFPIWMENDGNVHYAQVVYTPLPLAQSGSGQTQAQMLERMQRGLPPNAKLITGAVLRTLHAVPVSSLPGVPVVGEPHAPRVAPSPP